MEVKHCTKCEKTKATNLFSKNRASKDGFQYWCKDCVIKDSRTIRGVIRKIYSRQRQSCRDRLHDLPTYTRRELEAWVSAQPLFFSLYREWVKSGFKKDLAPSIDRKNDYESYTFDNIQIMSWEENRIKSYTCEKTLRNREKQGVSRKTTFQFSLDGVLIEEFLSTQQACKATGVSARNIASCCRRELLSAGGFLWSYTNESPCLTSKQMTKVKNTIVKQVANFKDGVLVSTFKSSSDASRKTGIPQQSISANCRGKMKQAGGFVWKFI